MTMNSITIGRDTFAVGDTVVDNDGDIGVVMYLTTESNFYVQYVAICDHKVLLDEEGQMRYQFRKLVGSPAPEFMRAVADERKTISKLDILNMMYEAHELGCSDTEEIMIAGLSQRAGVPDLELDMYKVKRELENIFKKYTK